MKISYNWLQQYITINETPEKLSELLTDTGLEVEGLEKFEAIKGGLEGLVIGEVLSCEKHPNADNLSITTVNVGNEVPSPIVCGAPNVAVGQKVIVAKVGTTLHPMTGDSFKIKKAKIRGELSEGMICAEDEIGIGTSHDGIMVLETSLKPGSPVSDYFNLETDYIFEIGLTPNRADATSHIGVARDIKAITGNEVNWPSVNDFKVDDLTLPIEVTVGNKEACPRYSGVTLSNIKIGESPGWLKNKLISIGLTPVNNVVDVTNYVLHETGQPLHAFDYEHIKDKKVAVKTLGKGTSFTTLDEKERKLYDSDLMICDSEGPMCIAGVFGGIHSGISDGTTCIFLESAYFDAAYIRKTATLHQLKTDASFRYERGTDPNITVYALKRAAMLLKEVAGATVSSEIIDIYTNPVKDFEVPVTYKNINRLIGQKVSKDQIHTTLSHLDIRLENITDLGFTAMVPPYRVDVQREADIIEEILRIYGFNNILLPENVGAEFLANSPEKDHGKIQEKVSKYLVSNGLFEIMTNSLTKPEYAISTDAINELEQVEILNKLSEDLGVMRQSLLFTGLEVIAYNINHKQKNLKLFEFGKTYFRKQEGYKENEDLSILLTGSVHEKSWNTIENPIEFHHLKGIIESVLTKLNIKVSGIEETKSDIFQYGLSYKAGQKTVVHFGSLSSKILRNQGIKQEVLYACFDWSLLLRKTSDNIMVGQVSKYPEVRRDLSLVIDKSVSYQDILELTQKLEKNLIKSVDVFDVYEGDRIEQSKKAYALKFILQDNKKTLTDKVIDKTMKRLIHSFEKELGAIIRQ